MVSLRGFESWTAFEATRLGGALGFNHDNHPTKSKKVLKSGQSTVVRFTKEHKGMRDTLRAHFSQGIA